MNYVSKRNLLIVLGVVGGFVLIFDYQKRVRINSFEEGFNCLLKGSYKRGYTPPTGCFDYFEEKINTLNAEIDEQPETELGEAIRSQITETKNKWIDLRDNGAWRDHPVLK